MTAIQDAAAMLSPSLPHMVCPSQVDLGDVVRFQGEDLPVIIASGAVIDDHRVFTWVSQARTSNDAPVTEGQGIHDAGEMIQLLAHGETVRADEIRDGDLLILEGRTSLWGVVVGDPRPDSRGVLDIAWRSGSLPSGMPATIGWLQREPHQMLRRAPRAGAR